MRRQYPGFWSNEPVRMFLGIFTTQSFLGLIQKVNQIAMGFRIVQENSHLQEYSKIKQENTLEDIFQILD